MKIPVVSLLLPLGVESFQIMPARPVVRLLNKAVEGETHITVNPMEGYKGVDLARAKECAEHFGECSVEEMEDLRKNLHKERLQRFMVGEPSSETGRVLEESLEHRLLEEELDLQLAMLKDHEEMTFSTLFPEVEAPMEELPHLKDNTKYAHDKEAIHKAELALALEETVLEESVLEAAALCAVVALMILVPQILHV